MGYDLQTPIGLKDGADEFELIPYHKNPNVKGSQEETTKRYNNGFSTKESDVPIIVPIHRKQEPKRRRYTSNAILSEEENEEMTLPEKEEEIIRVPTEDEMMEINLGITEDLRRDAKATSFNYDPLP